jgi:hypothetical protein
MGPHVQSMGTEVCSRLVVVAEEVEEQNCVLGITEVVNWMYGY